MNEKELLSNLILLKARKAEMENALASVTGEIQKTEVAIIDFLEANNADSTANYDGIGKASLSKPVVYAHVTKENEEKLFQFLKDEGMESVIKNSVHIRTLSAFIAERIGLGEKIPEFINYYLKPTLRVYAAK
jgi:hypothetical protein